MKFNFYENIFTILNIQNIGITKVYGDIDVAWFISALFWGLCFYFYLYKIIDKKWFNLICACIIVFCYSYLVHAGAINYKNSAFVFNFGMMRALAGIGVGYFISMIYKDNISNILSTKKNSIQLFFYSVAEIILLAHLLYISLMYKFHFNNMIFIINFIGLFWLFLIRKGFLSRLLNNNISVFLGKFTFSIFLTHNFIFDIWGIVICKNNSYWVLNHPILNIVLPFILILIFGVITYYAFEKPITKYLKNTQKP